MRTLLYLIFLIPISTHAQFETREIAGPRPWTSLKANDSEESFQFAIVTDRTGGHRPGIFEDAVRKLNLLQPEFVVSVGDLIEGYTEDREVLDAEWDEFNGFIDKLQMPFFYLPGNHDYTNEVMAREWKKRFGPDYYHFKYKDVLFLCMNSSGDMLKQHKYFRQVLESETDVRWTFVFIHHPLFTYPDQVEWDKIEGLLVDREHTVFSGHHHRYVKYRRNQSNYVVLATTGGASPLRGDQFGEFDHVAWITMTEEGPIMANLKLDGILDQDISTEETKTIVDNLHFGEMLKLDPIYCENDSLAWSKTQLKITNSTDLPASVSISNVPSPYLITDLQDQTLEMQPNSVEMIEINVAPRFSCSIEEITPVNIKANVTYDITENNPVSFAKSLNLRPAKRYTLDKQPGLTIDGDLSDWQGIDFYMDEQKYINADLFSHSGTEDAFFSFAVVVDDDNLILGISIKDEDIISEKSEDPFKQDGIGVLIDPRHSSTSAYTTRHALFSQVMYIGASPGKDDHGTPYIYKEDKLPPKSKLKYKKTAEGWDLEVALPLRYIRNIQGDDWSTVRINVFQTDLDKDGAHFTEILWKPDWRNSGTYTGSGMFRKAE